MRPRYRLFALFGAASLGAVLSGAAAIALNASGSGAWAMNLVAWASGLALAILLAGSEKLRPAQPVILAVAAIGLAATFAFPGQHGVHRWLDIGPVHASASALLLPPAVVALGRIGIWSLPGISFAAAIPLFLIAQPDASQASAFLASAALLFARSRAPRAARLAAIAIAVGLAAASWLRPDPLQPVAEVEGIVALAAQTSLVLAAFAVFALAAACLSPLASGTTGQSRDPALALAAYFSACALMPLVGAYPVPLAGLGMSFPVGFWLGIGSLAATSAGTSLQRPPIPFVRRAR